MSHAASPGKGSETTDVENEELPSRTQRALEEFMTTLDDLPQVDGAPDMYTVTTQSGSTYVVDLYQESCECGDARHRDPVGGCKHIRRAKFATGRVPIPAAADVESMDEQLGEHVDGPRFE